jgi:biotin-(acetyl-CoA carboxylase) ligase
MEMSGLRLPEKTGLYAGSEYSKHPVFRLYIQLLYRNSCQGFSCQFDNDVKIKWPNDIILKGKKIVGILIEKKN